MTLRFVSDGANIFRLLAESEEGAWLIAHEDPVSPKFVAQQELGGLQRVETPKTFRLPNGQQPLTAAQEKRLQLIKPLLDDGRCITDRAWRSRVAGDLAENHNTTKRRVLRTYFHFLATGSLGESKKSGPHRNSDYDWAIRMFYFTSKRMSLKAAYEMMLIERFMDGDGNLLESAPSWSSFEHYYYRMGYHRNPQKIIARDGLSHYQRNERPLLGSITAWKDVIGTFQMDATEADIYLVSRFDRSAVVGRPYIYLAVDTATQLIAGVYVGLDAGESAVMACLANAALDKVAYCAKFGISITPEQWPSKGIPREILTDKGRDFCSHRMDEYCLRYGVELQSLPPFRPDKKGSVEKTFDLLQGRYKSLLRGKGIIEADAQERWSVDYRTQAVLDLNEFTQVIIHSIIYLNSGRILKDGRTPAQLWLSSSCPSLLQVDEQELLCQSLSRANGEMTRRGIRYNGLHYVPEESGILSIGEKCTLAVDSSDTSCIYLVLDGQYYRCHLTGKDLKCAGMDRHELNQFRTVRREQRASARQQEVKASINTTVQIRQIAAAAINKKSGQSDQVDLDITANRCSEKSKLSGRGKK